MSELPALADLHAHTEARLAGAAVFTQADVVASYYARQPYAPAAYAALLVAVPGRARALDLGCGPGPVAGELAAHFAEVVALDPSEAMITAGRAMGGPANIRWVCARAEDFDAQGAFDLVVAGASIHWVDPAIVFPKLAQLTGRVAMLGNDPTFPRPAPPCGIEAWLDFLERWNARVGRTTPAAWRGPQPPAPPPSTPNEAWIDVAGRARFAFVFRQSVADFVASCHARVSWPRERMGAALAAAFDDDLTALLAPHAGAGGLLSLDVLTDLVWGAPRTSPS
jgi:SAM-dependent methyltransferase